MARKKVDEPAHDSGALPGDSVAPAKPGAEARDLATSLLRKKKTTAQVQAALVASGVETEAATALVNELVRLRQPVVPGQLVAPSGDPLSKDWNQLAQRHESDEDRLSKDWKRAIYGLMFVPLGSWFIVIVTSYMYYYWRRKFPRRAAEVNRHGWIAWFLQGVLYLVLGFAIGVIKNWNK
jgi:hypothetical protein